MPLGALSSGAERHRELQCTTFSRTTSNDDRRMPQYPPSLPADQLQRQDDGRWPLWTIYALEDVTAIVIEAAALALGAAEDLRQNEPQATVEKGVTACLQAGQKIEQRLLEGPPPSETDLPEGNASETRHDSSRICDQVSSPEWREKMILGMDIGYGYTKAATARKRVCFASIVARPNVFATKVTTWCTQTAMECTWSPVAESISSASWRCCKAGCAGRPRIDSVRR